METNNIIPNNSELQPPDKDKLCPVSLAVPTFYVGMNKTGYIIDPFRNEGKISRLNSRVMLSSLTKISNGLIELISKCNV